MPPVPLIATLPLRAIPQPSPALVPVGDCGACVLGGVLGWDLPRVYNTFLGGPRSFHRLDMEAALRKAYYEGLVATVATRMPFWLPEHPFQSWGIPSWTIASEWYGYIRMAIEAGYYGLAPVSMRREGPLGHGVDHWVLITGARHSSHEGTVKNEILLSCSAPSTPDLEWVHVRDFLKERGGYDVLLVKPHPASPPKPWDGVGY